MSIERQPIEIHQGRMNDSVVHAARRRIWLEARSTGLSLAQVKLYETEATWFPWIRMDSTILATRPISLRDAGEQWCEPQIVVQFPDPLQDIALTPHVDVEPDWAAGRKYSRIIGVALTTQWHLSGAIVLCPPGADKVAPSLKPGDVVSFDPAIPHYSGLNMSSEPRVIIYHRLLAAP